ncbi:hypothetical protein VaNZ11_015336 [Volvox africanus]|uniref:GATA-type domain-containing protein n=1 Tax=Volvox africanus TaxID=51714 RepID=A0ABQ5SKA6_9CHLO|nr:hypothetical protein VaNZ11_015336 [Volvox africanus]
MVTGSKNDTTAGPDSVPAEDVPIMGVGGADKKPQPDTDASSPSGPRSAGPKPGSRCPECYRVNSGKWYRHKTRDGDYTCDGCYRFYKMNHQYRRKLSPEAAASGARESTDGTEAGTTEAGTATGTGSTTKSSKQAGVGGPSARRPGPNNQKPSATAGHSNADKGSAVGAGAKRKLLSEQDAGPRQKRAKHNPDQDDQEVSVDKEPQAEGQPGQPKSVGQTSKAKAESQSEKLRKATAKRTSQDGAQRKTSPPLNLRNSPPIPMVDSASCADGGSNTVADKGTDLAAVAHMTIKPERSSADAVANTYPKRRAAAVAAARGIAECSGKGNRGLKSGGHVVIGSGSGQAPAPGTVAGTPTDGDGKPQGAEGAGGTAKAPWGGGAGPSSKAQGGSSVLAGAAAVSVAKRIAMMKAAGELKCVICGNLESRRWCKHRQKLDGVTCERCDDYFRRHGFYSTKFKKNTLVQQPTAAAAVPQMAVAVEGVVAAKEQVAEPGSAPNTGKPALPAVQKESPDAGEGAAVHEDEREPLKVKEELSKEETDVKPVSDAAPATGAVEEMKATAAVLRDESPAYMSAIADEAEKEDQDDDTATTKAAAAAMAHRERDSAGQGYETVRPEAFHEAPMIETVMAEEGKGAPDAAKPLEMDGNGKAAESEAGPSDRGTTIGDEEGEDSEALRLAESLTVPVEAAPVEGAVASAVEADASKRDVRYGIGTSGPQPTTAQVASPPGHQRSELLNQIVGAMGATNETAGAEPPTGEAQEALQDSTQGKVATEPGTTSAGRTADEALGAEAVAAESTEGMPVAGITTVEADGVATEEDGRTAAPEGAAMDPGDMEKEGSREEAVGQGEAAASAVDMEADKAAECAEAAATDDTVARRMHPPHAGLTSATGLLTTRIQAGPDFSGSEAKGEARTDGFGDAARLEVVSEDAAAKLPPTKRAGLRRQPPKQQRHDKKQEEEKHDEKQDRHQEGKVEKQKEGERELEAKTATSRDNEQPKAALGSTANPRTSADGASKSIIAEPAARTAAPASAPSAAACSAKEGTSTGERTCAACGSNRTQSGWRRHQGGEFGKVVCKRCYDWHYRHGTYERTPAAQRTAPAPASTPATGTSSIVAALRRPRKAPTTTLAGAAEQPAKAGASDGAAAATQASDAVPVAGLGMTAAKGDDTEPPRKRQKRQRAIPSPAVLVSTGTPNTVAGSAEIMTMARVSRDGGAGVQRKDPGLGAAGRSLGKWPAEGQVDASGAASHSEMVADPGVLQSYLRAFCDALSRACKALVELEDQYSIRLLDIPAPPPVSSAAPSGDWRGTATPAAAESLLPSARSALRLFYERVCGSDAKLRSRHLADVLIRWLELNAWRSPLTMLLGSVASDMVLEREGPLNCLDEDTQVPSKSHLAATPSSSIAVPRPSSITAAAADRFREVVESLALNMAQNLLGLLPPATPRPRSASTAGNTVMSSTAALSSLERDACTPAKDVVTSTFPGAHVASMPHLESVAAAALHLANRVAAAPGRLALRLVAPGDPILAATTTTTTTTTTAPSGQAAGRLSKRPQAAGSMSVSGTAPSLPASGGSCSAVTAVEWVRCDAVSCGMEPPGLGKEADGDPGRHLRLAYLLRSVYAGGVAQWQDSNVALSLGYPSGGSDGVATGASAPAVLWMVSPGIVRRELRTDGDPGGVAEVLVPTVTVCGTSRVPSLSTRPSGIDALAPASAPPLEAVTAHPQFYVGDDGQAVEVKAAAEAADEVCAAVAKALARGDHDALLGATEAAAAVVLQLVRAMSKDGFPGKSEQAVVVEEAVDVSGKVAASAMVRKGGRFARLARDGAPLGPANAQQASVVVVEEPVVPALVIGCETGP